jgi:hypothetical protein
LEWKNQNLISFDFYLVIFCQIKFQTEKNAPRLVALTLLLVFFSGLQDKKQNANHK